MTGQFAEDVVDEVAEDLWVEWTYTSARASAAKDAKKNEDTLTTRYDFVQYADHRGDPPMAIARMRQIDATVARWYHCMTR
jgi:hypothetical protein